MAKREKVINLLKCEACQQRKKWRRSMRLCASCWQYIPVHLQVKIVGLYNINYDEAWVEPNEEFTRLIKEAVEIATAKVPKKKIEKSKNKLQCPDVNGRELAEQDHVIAMIGDKSVKCLVLGLAEEGLIRVRTLTHPPDIKVFPSKECRIIVDDIADA